MEIIKKINTSAVVARDSAGKEIVVFGKGLGFASIPYELHDLSKVERTFYDVDPRYIGMIADIPQSILMASADIAELAEDELECDLNPNLPFTLADHLNFASNRIKNGIDITTPIAYDIRHLYPKEYNLAVQALELLRERTEIILPAHEATSVAMHLINAEAESGDIDSLMMILDVISDVEDIVQRELNFTLDKESYHYSRFTMHLRYLIQRLVSGCQSDERGSAMLRTLAREYPEIYTCTRIIAEYFEKEHNWRCNDEETLYLMLHVHRVHAKDEE